MRQAWQLKYLAYDTLGRLCESCFGCNGIGESSFCIRCYETFRDKRCFELWMSQNCSDCYYVFGLNNCAHCMFCFNAKNLNFAIGNAPVAPDKFRQIKKQLLSRIAAQLELKKDLPWDVYNTGKIGEK
ncbi:hypothetical protein FJZ26_03715 [Candidatus Parvarchaeota archaeon]|nr:hypothetical protein [Candidatus Parvarchaeota archaeon]